MWMSHVILLQVSRQTKKANGQRWREELHHAEPVLSADPLVETCLRCVEGGAEGAVQVAVEVHPPTRETLFAHVSYRVFGK